MRLLQRTVLFAASLSSGTVLMPRMASAQTSAIAPVTVVASELTVSPVRENWLTYNGDYSGRRYSGLSQITPHNVAQLTAQWVFHSTNSDRLEVTPIVVDGLMIVTSANDAFALDARTGRMIWHHSIPK